jgi:hypothetical protein
MEPQAPEVQPGCEGRANWYKRCLQISLKSIGGEAGPFKEINEVADGTGTVGCSVQPSTGEKMP